MKGALKHEDRASESAKAKEAMLAKFKARPAPDPVLLAERAAAAKEREERRELAEMARKERLEAEKIEREEKKKRDAEAAIEAEFARKAAEDLARLEQAALEKVLLAKQKAARDARYAARKARSK